MPRSLIWYPRVHTILPPDEPMARLMARLFVLWQDLLFEEPGILADAGFQRLDKLGPDALTRRLYFLRGNSRTLVNARDLFKELGPLPTFRSWLAEDREMAGAYKDALKTFNRHRKHVEWVRNQIGGHIGEEVGEALRWFKSDDNARFEIHSEDFMRPHIATDIMVAALCRESEPSKRLAAYRAAVKPLALATGAMIRAMSIVAHVYAKKFQFLPT